MTTEPYPSLPRTVPLLLGTLVASAGLAWATSSLFPDWPEIVRLALPTELALLGAVAWAMARNGGPWRERLLVGPLEPRTLGPLALVLVGSITVFAELYVVMQRIVPVPAEFERVLRELLRISGPADLVATVIVAVIAAPVLEEALFRGVILRGLALRRGPRSAMVWTAAFFAFFHLYNPWQVVPTFFLGLVLAWVVLTTGSLVGSIVVHSAFNGLSLVIYEAPIGTVGSEAPAAWVAIGVVATLVLGSLALLVGMTWLEEQSGGGWLAEEGEGEETGVG